MTISPLIVKNDAWKSVQTLNEWYLLTTMDDNCLTYPGNALDQPLLCKYDDSIEQGFCVCNYIFG